ncbi:oligosaccharide flippase family protein [Oceanisphaera avium]|uniref:Uncharacterized protein n=1 Tax=Oceanisphaera avium TaxID=1903694 RepID=A0A1Y0D014_9GAMM|nr:oligosaccharide flippase family protein [Oceanisphaera avium]ART80932.1 hypothetical protein CBP12_12855 [Oceanisphaera avium]
MAASASIDKKSRGDLVFVYAAYTLRYLYLLLLIPFYGRVLGVEGYAVVLAAMSLMAIVWRFVDWGFSTVGMRSIAVLKNSQYADLFGEHFVARVMLSILAIIGGVIAVFSSPLLLANPIASGAAVMLGALSAFNLGWYYTGSGRARNAVKLEVIGFIVSLVLILSLVRDSDDSDIVLLSLLMSSIISLAFAHFWIRAEIRGAKYSAKHGVKLIKTSSVVFLYTGSSALLVSSSTYILSILASSSDVGNFGAAERLVSVGLSLMGPAGQIFLPRITALFLEDKALAYELIRKVMVYMLGIGFMGLICSLVIGDFAVTLIFGEGFEESIYILKWLALLFPLKALSLILSSYVLFPQHQEKILAKVVLVCALISLVVSIPLSYQFGAMGMVSSRLIGEALICTCLLYSCWKLGFLAQVFKFTNGLHK